MFVFDILEQGVDVAIRKRTRDPATLIHDKSVSGFKIKLVTILDHAITDCIVSVNVQEPQKTYVAGFSEGLTKVKTANPMDIPTMDVDPKKENAWREHISAIFPHDPKIKGTAWGLWLLSLPYADTPNIVYLIENPEYNLHPTLVEPVFRALASIPDGQVFCTTYSPLFISQASINDLILFSKNREVIRAVDHPIAQVAKAETIGDLYASGAFD